MVSHPAVRRVNFTGSTRVGKIIAQTCAKYLTQAVLELGGKAPFLVLDDADIDAAVAAAAFGAFANSGQICMSTERIVVDAAVADEFVAKLAAKAASLPLGDPRQIDALRLPVLDIAAQFETVHPPDHLGQLLGRPVEGRDDLVATGLDLGGAAARREPPRRGHP